MNTLTAGRMLNIASRVSSEQFTDPIERIGHIAREEAAKKVFADFDAARKARNVGSILLAVEKVRSNTTEVLDAAVAMAANYERDYPGTPELMAITRGRVRQRSEINAFFVAVQHGITLGAEQQTPSRTTDYIIGSWVGFFDGLRAGRYCSDLAASTLKLGKPLLVSDKEVSTSDDASHGGSTSEDGDDSDSKTRRREKAKERRKKSKERRKAGSTRASDGGGNRSSGGGGAAAARAGPLCRKGVHFPCSKTVVGPRLGVTCSATGPCRFCNKKGHWAGECPVGWAKDGHALPGYSENGKRYVDDWDAEKNPKKDCARLWLKFLRSKKHFPAGGVAALESRAPAFADFQAWVGKAQ
jgi:hypothetical protein